MRYRAWIILIGLVASPMLVSALGEEPTPSQANSFSHEGLLKTDVSTLKNTHMVATPDVPLRKNQNVLWCGTLQLAWNKATDLVGEKLHFANQPPVVELLNQEDFTSADLNAGSYVALADFERNNVEDEIRAALAKSISTVAAVA